MDSNHVTQQLHFSRSFHLQPVVSSDMFSRPLYPLLWLTCFCHQHGSRMDSNHVTRLLHFFRSSHLLLATYFPVRIFDLFLLPAWIVSMLPATCVPAFFFCWVFSVFYLSPSSSDCFREFLIVSFVFDRPVFNSIFIVLQILQQFPTAFEFIPIYLVRIAEHVNSQW